MNLKTEFTLCNIELNVILGIRIYTQPCCLLLTAVLQSDPEFDSLSLSERDVLHHLLAVDIDHPLLFAAAGHPLLPRDAGKVQFMNGFCGFGL